MIVAGLEWLGARARFALALSCAVALAAPGLAAALRPFLAPLVVMVYALSMTRLDLPALARRLARPRRAALVLGLSLALLAGATPIGWGVMRALDLGPDFEAAAVYALAAPPIASAAGFAFIMGLDAALTLEVTVVSSMLMPLIGPALIHLLLGAAAPIPAQEMALRTAAMILGGVAVAMIARRALGAARINRRARVFDGLVALAMTVFIIPLFDGVGPMLLARPGLSLAFLAMGCAIILIPHLLAAPLPAPRAQTGAAALVFGTRSVAIYLAALPPDPVFTLFVALYQLPMALSPLLLRRLYGAH